MDIIRDYTKSIMHNKTVTFGQPELVTNGTYFTRILYNNNPLYIQTPKCKTKHGFIKSNKKIYTELLFTNTEEDMLGWFEQLDDYCKEFMLLKSTDWFNSSLTKEDIDTLWLSTFKLYKSGKNTLIKVNVPIESIPVIKIYDDTERIKEMDDVNENTTVQTILEICGIRFTSRSYQLNIELKQMMIINNIFHPIFNKCLIKPLYMETLSLENNEESDILKLSNISDNNNKLTNPKIEITKDENIIEKLNEQQPRNLDVKMDEIINTKEEKDICMIPILSNDSNLSSSSSENNNFIMDEGFSKLDNIVDLEPIEIDNLGINITQDDIIIKDPEVIYLEMYNDRINNAKKLLYASKTLFQEAKQIKEKYKLNIFEDINEYISD